MKYTNFITVFILLILVKYFDCLHFSTLPNQSISRYVKTVSNVVLKWRVQLTSDELNSKTRMVWFRLEKQRFKPQNELEPSTYISVTKFHQVTERFRSRDGAYVKKFDHNKFDLGFRFSVEQQTQSGFYRLYVKTDDHSDYFSFAYELKVVEPPVFVQCLQRINAKTSEAGNSQFEETLPVLDIESTCIARGYPIPKVYCFIEETKVLVDLISHQFLHVEVESWNGKNPTIKCIADGGPAGNATIQRSDYFVFHKPIAPQGFEQLSSTSDFSINLRWKHLSRDDAGGDVTRYIIHYQPFWDGRTNTIIMEPPRERNTLNKYYYLEDGFVYFTLKNLRAAQNYTLTLQAWNSGDMRSDMTIAIMQSGYEMMMTTTNAPITPKQSSSLAKSTTMIIATFALAGLLILLLLIAILYRRRLHIRRARFESDAHERITEQRDFFNIAGSFTSPFVLPSYEEAVRSKPTDQPPSFEDIASEPFQEVHGQHGADNESFMGEPSGIAPPPYPGRILSIAL